MPQLTKQDKLAILKRLIKRVDHWLSSKSLPMIIMFGENDVSEQSQSFREWQRDVTEAVKLIFGKHSHYLIEFDEIIYTDILAALRGDKKAAKSSFWKGVEDGKRLIETMVAEVDASERRTLSLTVPT